MSRRCDNGMCLAMAGARSVNLDLPVATILMNPRREWDTLALGGRIRVARNIEVDWKKFSQDDYLFSHCSIVASVALEDDRHTIKEACNELVNNNGNAWSNEVLLATFKSFIGGENYLEHVQVPELSKGKLLDAVARPVRYKDSKGREADIYYVDILVATSRKHDDLVGKIASGKLTTMSMGCFKLGTLVLLSDGTTKPIESFQGGERVVTHMGRTEKVIRPIKTHWRGDMWRIWVEGNPAPIECTGNHRFLQLTGRKECLCGCGESLPHFHLFWHEGRYLQFCVRLF